jgi:hypothetical protein
LIQVKARTPDAGPAVPAVQSLEAPMRNILQISGVKPVSATLFGMVELQKRGRRERWLNQMRALGRRAA